MRVIAGTARRLKLVAPSGKHTRPTSDMIKETLFNMLQTQIPGCRFLDLFSGSGGIAIEALSRGAKEAVMVDKDREAVQCIKDNIRHTKFEDEARVISMDVLQAIRRLDQLKQSFSVVFMDPPYHTDIEKRVVSNLLKSSLVEEGSLVIIETALDADISWMEQLPCQIERIKDYKTNRHVFLKV